MRTVVTVGVAVFIILGLATTSVAETTYYGCVLKDGTLRIISPTQSCRNNETRIFWNATGPEGPAGPQGLPGPQGPGVQDWGKTLSGSGRFLLVLNEQAVLDQETGLVWEKSPQATEPHPTWLGALAYCSSLTVGNRMGWRLPTLQELASLVDPSVSSPGPTLPSGHLFVNVQQAGYWSATTHAEFSESARVISFYDGTVVNGTKTGFSFVWCVRGGQGLDAQ